MSVTIEEHSDTLFTVVFNSVNRILTTVTSSAADADAWVSEVLRVHRRRLDTLVVGLDIEWRPNFFRGQQNPAAVLQLCVGRRCLVFQILLAGAVPASLVSFLGDRRFSFVGVGVEGDVEKLLEDWEVGVGGNMVDLRDAAEKRTGRREMKQKGLAGLAVELMGWDVRKPKRVTMGRWDQDVLDLDQIKYACVDAFLSFEIGRVLEVWEPLN
ncbi:Werner Syndrome-like exonuclease [Iris pallida]|uniref:Werner Syndrome-like exonuclease n=1 Tax=Iris pallida TaxID=29817 RepID=A0AAX6EQC2_IRIPA|nr:Werner Syndrome-like exonuclease [Iris pallida]KAJ6828441.1 Werner Syndrome-like exonuclease [Iris pallida]